LRRGERIFNVVAGLSNLSWALMGLRQMVAADHWSVVRVSVAVLQLCVAALFICRRPIRMQGRSADLAWVIVSFIGGALAFHVAPAPWLWPLAASIPFAVGCAIAATSLLYLGRSFAVLPAVREIVARGPYRWIRHPAYAGELLMVACCCLADPRPLSAAVFGLNLAFLVLRIRIEEHVLHGTQDYTDYVERVRYRFIPGLW
jgi:protein-S-isoprenylcysteine O-methyltransferase Ste14